MQATSLSSDMQACIDECLRCYRSCSVTAMDHCLQSGGRHVEAEHFRLMLHCAAVCRTSAELMMGASPFHGMQCGLCAQICDACADSCQAIGDMDECAEACRSCAQSCHQMAGKQGQLGTGAVPGRPDNAASQLSS